LASESTTVPDFAVSAPAVVLAAAAARTERIRLSSAVTVLSSDDPTRVFQQFATVDELFGHGRFLGQISVGDLPHDKALRAIELLGTKVAPAVRAQIG